MNMDCYIQVIFISSCCPKRFRVNFSGRKNTVFPDIPPVNNFDAFYINITSYVKSISVLYAYTLCLLFTAMNARLLILVMSFTLNHREPYEPGLCRFCTFVLLLTFHLDGSVNMILCQL